jgi:predicted dehydrogenase
MTDLALALVGCGSMGRRHIAGMGKLKAANRMNFDLVAICNRGQENALQAADIAEKLLGRRPAVFNSIREMKRALPGLDAALITTTPHTHFELGLEALHVGLHVLMEKPITLTVPHGLQLIEAAHRAGRVLAVAENFRFDPMNQLAKALIDSGAVGQPYLLLQHASSGGEFVTASPWRHLKSQGGIIIDLGVHYGDMLEFFLGPVDSLMGMNALIDKQRVDKDGVFHTSDSEDLSLGIARYRSGALAHYLLNRAGRGENLFSRVVYGTGGSLRIPEDRSGRALTLYQRIGGKDVLIAEPLELVPDFALDDTAAALFGSQRLSSYQMEFRDIDACLLALEQHDFADALLNNRPPRVSAEQGVRALAVILGFFESDLLGRAITMDETLRGENLPYQSQIAP